MTDNLDATDSDQTPTKEPRPNEAPEQVLVEHEKELVDLAAKRLVIPP